jgi:peptide/nickel transport system substrate-binding protein
MKRRDFLAASVIAGAAVGANRATAQSARDTLVAISENGPNTMDPQVTGSNVPTYGIGWNCYDRLVSYGYKKLPGGGEAGDGSTIIPELAAEWEQRDLSITFKLRRDVLFQDGAPVTARDVKWSLDRALAVGGNPKFQLSTGSMETPEQFVVVDDHTFRVDLPKKNPATLPNLALGLCNVMNSELIRKNAAAGDPWGFEWTKVNVAGSGAYTVTSRTSDSVSFRRNPTWALGPLPQMERVIWRVVPSAASRRALIERGDADICNEFPPKDISELERLGNLTVYTSPIGNASQFIAMNVTTPPFDKLKVRQALAYATPYDKILDVALYGKARVLASGPAKVTSAEWPQPSPFVYDLAKARQLMAEAGLPDGFETTLSFDAGGAGILEPMCILIQESYAQIGVRLTLDKIPGSTWRAAFMSKKLPLLTNFFFGFVDSPNYYFDFTFGKGSIFNSMNYESSAMADLLLQARYETDKAKYDDLAKQYIQLSFDDVPSFPIYQPFQYVAMQKNLSGFRAVFHRQIDYRTLRRA